MFTSYIDTFYYGWTKS